MDYTLKQCTRCKQYKPATTEYFNKGRNYKDGLRSYCRECRKAIKKEKHKLTPKGKIIRESKELVKKGLKRCPVCEIIKPLNDDFWSTSNRSSNGFSSRCKECHSKIMQEYNHRPEIKKRRLDRMKEYYSKPEVQERKREYAKEYNKRPEIINRRNKWRRNNRQKESVKRKRSVHANNRNARKRKLPNTLSKEDVIHMLKYFDYKCAACGTPQDMFIRLEMDHWIPLSDENCPGTVATNIVPLCGGSEFASHVGCNQSKGNKEPLGWLIERFGNNKAYAILRRIDEYFTSLKKDESWG